ncbi:hypothetical protein Csa_014252, partial [Cucumis sativus]|uniref:Uncharacterized protein n=1 Tax=Cucumis sativus TaxID=3659 RepID=A0A0A0LWV8_CUCSA
MAFPTTHRRRKTTNNNSFCRAPCTLLLSPLELQTPAVTSRLHLHPSVDPQPQATPFCSGSAASQSRPLLYSMPPPPAECHVGLTSSTEDTLTQRPRLTESEVDSGRVSTQLNVVG